MIVKNEEKVIQRCLDSVAPLVDEMVVVDTGSTDRTVEILRLDKRVSVYEIPWENDFSKARNFAIEQSTGQYCLVVDADEYVTAGSRESLIEIMEQDGMGRVSIVSDFYKGKEMQQSVAHVTRFFPRMCRYEGAIHEQITSNLPRVLTDLVLHHEGYLSSDKGQRNIPLLLEELQRNPDEPYYLYQLGKELRIKGDHHQALLSLLKSLKHTSRKSFYFHELILEIIYSGKEIDPDFVLKFLTEYEVDMFVVADFHFAKALFFLDYCLHYPQQSSLYIMEIEKSFKDCLSLRGKPHVEYVKGTSSFLAAYNLALFYELTNQTESAKRYYQMSANEEYQPAKERLERLGVDN